MLREHYRLSCPVWKEKTRRLRTCYWLDFISQQRQFWNEMHYRVRLLGGAATQGNTGETCHRHRNKHVPTSRRDRRVGSDTYVGYTPSHLSEASAACLSMCSWASRLTCPLLLVKCPRETEPSGRGSPQGAASLPEQMLPLNGGGFLRAPRDNWTTVVAHGSTDHRPVVGTKWKHTSPQGRDGFTRVKAPLHE